MRYMIIVSTLFLLAAEAEARPYRALHTRTPRSTRDGNFELGLRYQGLLMGEGRGFDPGSFHQLALTMRWGALDILELDLEAQGLYYPPAPGSDEAELALGDVRAAAQLRLLQSGSSRLGVLVGVTLPTGPSAVDLLPPFVHDGTFDVEALLLFELAPGELFRLMFDVGYQLQGTRDRGARGDFDVPDALRYDVALGLNVGRHALLLLELAGRHYLEPAITPVWTDNEDIVELAPAFRFETSPGLVLELGAGFALTDDTQSIYRFRLQGGFTYEFSL